MLSEHEAKALGQWVRMWLWAGIAGAASGVVISWLLAHSSYATNYVYGRPLIFPVLLVLGGVSAWTRSARHVHRSARILGWLTVLGLALISIGLIGDYWIGQRNSVTLWRLGFLFDLIGSSLGLLCSTALGVVLLRDRSELRLATAALMGVIPLTIGLAFLMEGYIPSFPVVALCLVWGLKFAYVPHRP
jgi:hypothetical protein